MSEPRMREGADVAATPLSFAGVAVDRPDDVNVTVGQSHFIKTVDDLHEALAGVSPYLRFGIGLCEASGGLPGTPIGQ